MSSSTAGTKRDISWMDRDNEYVRPLMHGEPVRLRPKPAVYRGLYFKRLRDDYNAAALDHLPNPARRRRIVAYAVNEANGSADQCLQAVRDLIAQQDHDVVHEVTDVRDRILVAPQGRPGWSKARHLVHCGFADGIAAIDRNAISPRDDEYEEELHWLGQRFGTLLLIVPEAAT